MFKNRYCHFHCLVKLAFQSVSAVKEGCALLAKAFACCWAVVFGTSSRLESRKMTMHLKLQPPNIPNLSPPPPHASAPGPVNKLVWISKRSDLSDRFHEKLLPFIPTCTLNSEIMRDDVGLDNAVYKFFVLSEIEYV